MHLAILFFSKTWINRLFTITWKYETWMVNLDSMEKLVYLIITVIIIVPIQNELKRAPFFINVTVSELLNLINFKKSIIYGIYVLFFYIIILEKYNNPAN